MCEKLFSDKKFIFRSPTNVIVKFGSKNSLKQLKSCQCSFKDTVFGAACGPVASFDDTSSRAIKLATLYCQRSKQPLIFFLPEIKEKCWTIGLLANEFGKHLITCLAAVSRPTNYDAIQFLPKRLFAAKRVRLSILNLLAYVAIRFIDFDSFVLIC